MWMTGGRGPSRRRRRWAAREDSRRQIRYAAALARWQRTDGDLASLIATATTFHGYPAGRAPGRVQLILRPGERMFGQVTRTFLVFPNRARRSPVDGYAGYSALAACELAASGGPGRRHRGRSLGGVAESGAVTVTDQRIVFHGALRDWEWSLDHLVGVRHHGTVPLTVIDVDDRAEPSGLAYPRPQAAQFRFLVALAMANRTGEVDGLLHGLCSDRAEHAAARPAVPPAVQAEGAPGLPAEFLNALRAVYLGQPGQPVRWRLAQSVSAVIATAGVLALLTPHSWLR